jgi:putative heme-binding domain-containing protein
MGATAVPELEKLWSNTSANPRMRARAFWVLVKMPEVNAQQYIDQAIKDNNADLRITALRAARQLNNNLINVISRLVNDKDIQVRRECALALHHNKSAEAAALWTTLATQYDGKDRWYLEALGIGADRQWDNFFAAYKRQVGDPLQTAASKNIVWRARTDAALPYLSMLALAPQITLNERLKYFRAFDFNSGALKSKLLLKMIQDNTSNDTALNKLALHALDINTVRKSPVAQRALMNILESVYGTDEYIELVNRYEIKSQNNNLLRLALSKPQEQAGRNASGLLLKLGGENLVWNIINGKDSAQQDSLLIALARVGSKTSIDIFQTIVSSNKYPMPLRKMAAKGIGRSGSGEDRVLEILKKRKLPTELIPDMVASVSGAWRGFVRTEAASYLPESVNNKTTKPAPSLKVLIALKASADEGKKIFTSVCAICHQVNNTGTDFGPKLSEIGTKLPKEGLLEAIVHPSSGIGFGYEGWQLKMKDGSMLSGILTNRTETDITIKLPGGDSKEIKTAEVDTMTKMKQSMMPEGLYQNMSEQDLANLLEYLEGLKKRE